MHPPIYELFSVRARGTKVDELDLPNGYRDLRKERTKDSIYLFSAIIPQEIRPVRVRLHHSELEQLFHAEIQDSRRDLPSINTVPKKQVEKVPHLLSLDLGRLRHFRQRLRHPCAA